MDPDTSITQTMSAGARVASSGISALIMIWTSPPSGPASSQGATTSVTPSGCSACCGSSPSSDQSSASTTPACWSSLCWKSGWVGPRVAILAMSAFSSLPRPHKNTRWMLWTGTRHTGQRPECRWTVVKHSSQPHWWPQGTQRKSAGSSKQMAHECWGEAVLVPSTWLASALLKTPSKVRTRLLKISPGSSVASTVCTKPEKNGSTRRCWPRNTSNRWRKECSSSRSRRTKRSMISGGGATCFR
mmetsp:Transcript_85071/g.214419  ORF Transcript_85071/g.214419 Transcript_85071/m.214419 type:complete len:244 (-) Transcript_85071:532-1263(-)